MIRVGITGNMGSGKSAACRMFEALGIPVYDADARAKQLIQQEHYLIDEIKKNFGEDIYEDGVLNRERLAKKVFGDKKKLALLNSLVHPAVFRDTERWVAEQKKKNVPYVVKEAALLVESGSYKKLDKLIVVTAPEEMRIDRVKRRDGSTKASIRKRMKHQMAEQEKMKLADYIIHNDKDLAHLEKQVMAIHRKLLKLNDARH